MSITLNDIRGASDPLRQYNYELIIPTLPIPGNPDVIRLLVLDTAIPGFSVSTFESHHYGFTIKHPGKGEFPRTIDVTYQENNKLEILKTFRLWRELLWNTVTGHQVNAKTIGILKLLDLKKNVIDQIVFGGLFFEEVGNINMSGEAGGPVNVPIRFSYDTHVIGLSAI